ncbi:MAG: branched-chain amino acid transaminase [Acidobacteriaceae bacterium]|nr:branched-chain amino acid transaminase [Acidobacteriaceae bacterium]
MKSEAPNLNSIVWFNNRFVRLAEANVNILTHGLNYGTGVFEGIRGYYDTHQAQLYLFRVLEHFERWKQNCGILRIGIDASAPELCDITAELCRRNDFHSNIYVRPIAYKSSARIGVAADDNDAYAIIAMPFGSYFEHPRGLKAGVSSWCRVDDTMIPGRAKICGSYVNSVLAGDEARRNGHDEAIFLNADGHVAEGATCNIFVVRKGKLITPPVTDNILEGITRASLMELAHKELGLDVVERSIDRSELYLCDEIFFVGTAVEVAPIIAIDHRKVGTGEMGPITQKIRSLYMDAVRGRMPAYSHWLSPAYNEALLAQPA